MSKPINLTNEELVKEYQAGNEAALTQLIENNMKLIYYFAKRLYPTIQKTPFDKDDLVQEGLIGFMQSVEKFEHYEGVKFITYAGYNVRYAMLTFINRRVIEREYKNNSTSRRIHTTSLNEIIPGSTDLTLEAVIQDKDAEQPFNFVDDEIDNDILREDLLNLLEDVLGRGSFRVRVLKMYYGFEGLPLSFDDVGELCELSGSRVQQLHNDSIWRIRKSPGGQAFMKKYQWMMLNSLEDRRDELNQFMDTSRIVCEMETIDELINNVLSACG
ncbi:sigma-70 family RNA polymerase sigma factor [Sporomusa sphaeroides]|uniref:RNA polymerase sigma factor SigA n=1 Tax=Sporomusa sphaeroides DSM 2875 TaxID=1337886 RepID=A0ABM9W2N0_9FIRM|nr:sigma-70 family RNA polymerase sigma factor [Sporomusa sphaeroides]OLS56157.1 RNA polymerase sigma factor SigA [Sporomusa sphaeroides DSM 2875]CVK19201.1 RNA polymerase sigma factor SigA [Sporomusa sphaeroides DSM 2875]